MNEFLPNEAVTADIYRCQLNKLYHLLLQKRTAIVVNRRKVIILHDNASSHFAKAIKDTLFQRVWEVLPHSACSPDIAPSAKIMENIRLTYIAPVFLNVHISGTSVTRNNLLASLAAILFSIISYVR